MKRLSLFFVSLAVFIAALFLSQEHMASAGAHNDDTVKICHSTSSSNNPYVVNSPDKNGDVSGHDGHNGGVYPSNPWGDIIPPFSYQAWEVVGSHQVVDQAAHWECPSNDSSYTSNDSHKDCKKKINGSWKYADKVYVPATYKTVYDYDWVTKNYPGKNWTNAGQTIYNNNCTYAAPTPTNTPTPTPTQEPTCTPTPTPTIDPGCTGTCINIDCPGGGTCEVNTGNTPTPTETPKVTDTPTPTPTVQQTTTGGSGDGLSDGRSDGLSSCPSCTQAPQGQAAGAQAVLGASTMAHTGVFDQTLMNISGIFGMLFLAAGYKSYAKDKKSI